MQRVGEIGGVNLHRRDVDRDGQWRGPGCGGGAGGAQHPFADLQDQAAFLGDRNEDGGRDVAAIRVLPAQQGFKAADLAGLDVDLRLVDEPQLMTRNGVAKVVLQQPPVAYRGAHGALVEAVDPTAVLLGAVERGVGVRHQLLGRVAILRIQGNANRGADHGIRLGSLVVLMEGVQQGLGDRPRCVRGIDRQKQ